MVARTTTRLTLVQTSLSSFIYKIFAEMARRAVVPDTDNEEITGLLNEHALGTVARSGSRPRSKREGGRTTSPKAGSSSKTPNVDAHDNRAPNGNLANKAVKRVPEHTRQTRSATRSVEPQAVPERKRKVDVYDGQDVIPEEKEEHVEEVGNEDHSPRTAEPAPQTPQKKKLARPSKKLKSRVEAQAAAGREQAPQNSRAILTGPEGNSERRHPVTIQDSEVDSQGADGEVRDSVEEETAEPEATNGIELDAPSGLDEASLQTKMLLGNEHLWNTIVEASKANRGGWNERSRLKSKIIYDLVEKLTEARQIYHSLAADDLGVEEVDRTEAELEMGLDEIRVSVDDLSKSSAGRQASRVIHEAYMNGASQFVSLLKDAMNGRVLKNSPRAYDLDGLEEVVFIQEMFVRLLEKLSNWNISSEGYTKNVQQRIKPNLRIMLKNFKTHLERERKADRRRMNQEITASQAVAESVSPRAQQERKAARFEEIQRRILRSAAEESIRWGGNLRLLEEVRPPVLHKAASVRATETGSDVWTMEEDTALIHELLNNKDTRGLPGMTFLLLAFVLSFQILRASSGRAVLHDLE